MTEHQRPFYNLCNSQWHTPVVQSVLSGIMGYTSDSSSTSDITSTVSSHELGSMHVGYLSVEDDKARNKHPVQ